MNNVNLIGRLTRDPEPKKTTSGITALSFCLAVDRRDQAKTTDFINCQAWRGTADFISSYFHKGDPIAITGQIITRSYEKNGQTIRVTEVLTNNAEFVPKSSGGSRTETEQEDNPFEINDGGLSF
jgi:single-strand DNA-binding protein